VAVRSTYPAFFHVMFGQKKLFVVRANQPYQAKLWRAPFGFRIGHHYHIIIYVINSAHYSSPHLDKLAAISARDSHTMATNCFAASVISCGRPASRAEAETNSPPTPSASAPARMKSPAVFRFTPPVGMNGIRGKGPRSALM